MIEVELTVTRANKTSKEFKILLTAKKDFIYVDSSSIVNNTNSPIKLKVTNTIE